MKKLMDTMEESLQAPLHVVQLRTEGEVDQDVKGAFFSQDAITPKESFLSPCQETRNRSNDKSISFFE